MREFLFLLVLTSSSIIAQDICETPPENFDNLNSIAKCAIEKTQEINPKNTRQISIRTTHQRRYLNKRSFTQKNLAHKANTISSDLLKALVEDN